MVIVTEREGLLKAIVLLEWIILRVLLIVVHLIGLFKKLVV
jgi:hypothetical protein